MKLLNALRHSSHLQALLTQAVSAIFGMLTFLALARWMGPEGAGVVVLFVAATTMVDMLRTGFFQPVLVRLLQSEDEQVRASLRGTTLGMGGLFSLVVGGLLVLASGVGLMRLVTEHEHLFGWIWGGLLLVAFPGQVFSWLAQAESRFDRMLVYRSVGGFLLLAGIVFLHLTDRLNPETVGMAFIVSAGGLSIVVAIAGWLPWRDVAFFSAEHAREIARFGRYSMTTTLGTALLRSSDTFLIGALAGPAPVALYSVAQKAAEILDLPLRALGSSMYPVLAEPGLRGEGRRVGRIIERAVSGYWLAILVPALLLFLLAEPLVRVAAGDAYLGAVPAMKLFIFASFLMPFDRMIGLGLDSLGRPEVNMGKVAFMLTANVIGDVLVLLSMGSIAGVAFVTIVMNTIGLIVGWWILQPTIHLSPSRMGRLLSYWVRPSYVRLQIDRSRMRSTRHV